MFYETWTQKSREYNGRRIILYLYITSAGVWNYCGGTRIVLQQKMQEMQHWIGTSVDVEPFTSQAASPAPEESITEMVTEIC